MVTTGMKLKDICSWKGNDKPRQHIKIKDITLPIKAYTVKAMFFPVAMYGCESRTIKLKNWHFWTVVLEKILEGPLDSKEIKPVSPKGNQPWILIGRTDAEAEASILWPPDAKNWLLRKDPDVGKDWRQEEKGITEDEIIGWHHQFNGHKSEQTPGDSEGQGGLACCSPWGHRESNVT